MWDLDHRQAIDTTPNKRTETGSLCGRRVSHRLLSMRGAAFYGDCASRRQYRNRLPANRSAAKPVRGWR
ncbi:MAG TPA: hypothetical protein DCE55_00045 [Planctomycetaceae bacterium]|nr:hypothetical protein [Planctomycetaceae bacterium]